MLRGHIDVASRGRIAGWVQETDRPDVPVSLRIIVDDKPFARVLANRYRADLVEAGIGNGRHGFDHAIDSLRLPHDICHVAIIQEADDAPMPGSPFLLRQAALLDDATRTDLIALFDSPCDDEELHRRIMFLAEQTDRLLQRHADGLAGRDEHAAWAQARRWANHASPSSPRTPRILIIDEKAPAAGRDAGSEAILSHVTAFRRLGYTVSFAAADMMPCPDAALPARFGMTMLHAPWFASIEEVLRRQGSDVDLVYLHRPGIAACYMALARRSMPKARLIYGVADLHHVRLQRQAEIEENPELMALARRMRAQELTAARSADVVLTHSTAEAALLRRDVPEARVCVVPWAVPARPTPVPFAARAGIAFIGHFGHVPNIDAALWLAGDIMPRVWAQMPGIQCFLAGSAMPNTVRALAQPGIIVLDQVADLAALFDKVRLTVAPLAYGAGVKGKVLASLAAGVPCACTPVAAEGIDLPGLLLAQIGADSAEIAAIMVRLHEDDALNTACATAGLDHVKQRFSEASLDTSMTAAIAAAGAA